MMDNVQKHNICSKIRTGNRKAKYQYLVLTQENLGSIVARLKHFKHPTEETGISIRITVYKISVISFLKLLDTEIFVTVIFSHFMITKLNWKQFKGE
jgi:hypothetical protein